MYEGVPMAVPARVASTPEFASRMRATPKSSTFTWLSVVMKMSVLPKDAFEGSDPNAVAA